MTEMLLQLLCSTHKVNKLSFLNPVYSHKFALGVIEDANQFMPYQNPWPQNMADFYTFHSGVRNLYNE